MAGKKTAKGGFEAGFDFKGLPGGVSWGSNAFYRKVATQDARLAMKEIIANYASLLKNIKAATPEILAKALVPVFKKAQYYVPEDTGNLWASGTLDYGVKPDGKAYARIQFGDETAWYAALVHEYTWLNHESPTRSKYLQAAMEEGLSGVIDSLKASYSGMIG